MCLFFAAVYQFAEVSNLWSPFVQDVTNHFMNFILLLIAAVQLRCPLQLMYQDLVAVDVPVSGVYRQTHNSSGTEGITWDIESVNSTMDREVYGSVAWLFVVTVPALFILWPVLLLSGAAGILRDSSLEIIHFRRTYF